MAGSGCSAERDDGAHGLFTVATAVQAVADRLAGAGGDRGCAGVPGEARFAAEALRAGGAADDDRGGDGADAGLLEWLWAAPDERGELAQQVALLGEISLIRRRSAFATHCWGLCGSLASWRASRARIRGPSEPPVELRFELGSDAHQMPAQPVDQPVRSLS